jgi:FkbM family methyltransferase
VAFISYAQNYEDVILSRVFTGLEKGCYVDVGANDPVLHSVTKAFYDNGWRGVNVEPVQQWYQKLEEQRLEDRNIQAVVSTAKGKVDFFEVVGTGLSTTDKNIALKHAVNNGFLIKGYSVDSLTLSDVIKANVSCSDIHFLKVDVEGAEKDVLQSIDLKLYRPWVILVEATEPMSSRQNHSSWEPILINEDYEFVYFDGLNRFYLAKEHMELSHSFSYPPCVFDEFITSYQFNLQEKVAEQSTLIDRQKELKLVKEELERKFYELSELNVALNEEVANLRSESEDLKEKIRGFNEAKAKMLELSSENSRLHERFGEVHQAYESVVGSLSWKVSYPLRLTKKLVVRFVRSMKRIIKLGAKRVFAIVMGNRYLKRIVKLFLIPFGGVKDKLIMYHLRWSGQQGEVRNDAVCTFGHQAEVFGTTYEELNATEKMCLKKLTQNNLDKVLKNQ